MSIFTMFGDEEEQAEIAQGDTSIQVPTHCPECQFPLRMEGEYLVCKNSRNCPAQVTGAMKAWIKKLGILDFGTSLIEAVVGEGLASTIDDLYRLQVAQVSPLLMSGRRVGDSTAKRALNNLHAKKHLSLANFIGSLGIPMVARSMCKTISQGGFDTVEKMLDADIDSVASIPGVGRTKAESFVMGIAERKDLIQNLLDAGITIKKPAEGPLKGKLVCMTGFRSKELEEAIEDAGGIVKSGVSRKLDILVAADPTSTSGKAKKARQYGIEIIDESEMWGRLG